MLTPPGIDAPALTDENVPEVELPAQPTTQPADNEPTTQPAPQAAVAADVMQAPGPPVNEPTTQPAE